MNNGVPTLVENIIVQPLDQEQVMVSIGSQARRIIIIGAMDGKIDGTNGFYVISLQMILVSLQALHVIVRKWIMKEHQQVIFSSFFT